MTKKKIIIFGSSGGVGKEIVKLLKKKQYDLFLFNKKKLNFCISNSKNKIHDILKKIKPDILIKGGDYKANEIVGSDFVKENNGEIKIIPFVKGCSTTNIIKKINKSSD